MSTFVIEVRSYARPSNKTRYLKTVTPHPNLGHDIFGFSSTVQRARALKVDETEAKSILTKLKRNAVAHTFTVVEVCEDHHFVCTKCGATSCQ